MGTTPVKVEDFRHAKMKELAAKCNMTIQALYAEAIDAFLAGKYQDMILADSKLEEILNGKFNKIADRLAGMINSNNIDTSTILMAITHLNSNYFKEDRDETYQMYRKEGAAYENAKRNKK